MGARLAALAALAMLVLSSCIDVAGKITFRRDGGGTVELEYVLAKELHRLAELDGNSRWPPLPAGSADFERAAARVPGLSFRSGSVSPRGDDVAVRARLDFADPAALAAFLDGLGRTTFAEEGGRARLSVSLAEGGGAAGAPFRDFAGGMLAGRHLELSLSLPAPGELYLAGSGGTPLDVPPGWTVSPGKDVLFRAPLAGLLLAEGPLHLVASWPRD